MAKGSRNNPYKNQAKKALENYFPRISCDVIRHALVQSDFDFPTAYRNLATIERFDHGAEMLGLPIVLPQKIRVFLKNDRPKKKFILRNEKLLAEIQAITTESSDNKENVIQPTIIDLTEDDVEDRKQPAISKEIECGCCFGDYPREEMKQCAANKGHMVCHECVSRYVSEQLDGNNSIQFQCIIDENCHQEYPLLMLDQVLSPRLKQRTNHRIALEEAEKCGIKIWTCPKCNCQGLDEGSYSTIECPSCDVFYCVTCNEEDHHPRSCDDVRKEKDLLKNPVHRAHEAMSAVVTRNCPSCRQEFVKHDGCNKMKCSKCKTLSCYLCSNQIQGYDHFCNHKKNPGATGCACGKSCELWTSTEKMEQRDRSVRREAGTKILHESGISIEEIDRILGSPDQKKKPALKTHEDRRETQRVHLKAERARDEFEQLLERVRAQGEQAREQARIAREQARVAREQAREQARAAREQARAVHEQARAAHEQARDQLERARAQVEQIRAQRHHPAQYPPVAQAPPARVVIQNPPVAQARAQLDLTAPYPLLPRAPPAQVVKRNPPAGQAREAPPAAYPPFPRAPPAQGATPNPPAPYPHFPPASLARVAARQPPVTQALEEPPATFPPFPPTRVAINQPPIFRPQPNLRAVAAYPNLGRFQPAAHLQEVAQVGLPQNHGPLATVAEFDPIGGPFWQNRATQLQQPRNGMPDGMQNLQPAAAAPAFLHLRPPPFHQREEDGGDPPALGGRRDCVIS